MAAKSSPAPATAYREPVKNHDIVIIGAGLAGLRCAASVAASGRGVTVLEAEDVVGGRQRTIARDGFLLDRGFQVLNPAYPAVKRWVDIDELDLRTFPVGVRVRRESGISELSHPLRHPSTIIRTLRSGLVSPRDAAALLRWIAPALIRPRAVISGTDRTLTEGLDRVGLHGPLRTEVLETFLSGVIADDSGQTSDAFVRLLVRMFVLGAPGVPAAGIAALPAQLARKATAAGADIRLGMRVQNLRTHTDGVELDVAGSDPIRARDVIVAVGPGAVTDLLDMPRPATKGLQTWWFSADSAPTASALISVDGRRNGPVVNTVVMSNTAPSYAPAGKHLIEATCLLASAATEADVRSHLAEIWGVAIADWQLLQRDDIPDALPAQPAPLSTERVPRHSEHVYFAGDHRDTASIQGALVSGERAAHALLG